MTVLSKKSLTIIITAHSEGDLSDLSVSSILKAAKKLDKIGIEYDILVNIDRGDRKTIDYFERLTDERISINYSDYGDPGLARNAAIRKAKGRYLAMIDADDAVSGNWLVQAMKRVMNSNRLLLAHPEIELRYSKKGFISLNVRSNLNSLWEDTLALILGNRWCSVVVGKREVFLKNPYSKSADGFGYEDYYFNCMTVYSGVEQTIIHGTTAFCLQKEKSITKKTHKNNEVLPYLELFNYKYLQKQMVKNGLPQYSYEKEEIKVPRYVLSQLIEFCDGRNGLGEMIKEVEKLMVNKNDAYECVGVGELFCKMVDKIRLKKKTERMYFVNNIVDYYEKKINNDSLVVMLGEENNLPTNGNVLDFYRFFGGAPFWIKEAMMVKIMIEFKIRSIIVCDNEFAKKWVRKYKSFMEKNEIEVRGVL